MAKSKVGKIELKTVDGIDLKEPLKLDVFYEDRFFIYTPEYLIASIKPEDRDTRHEGAKKFEKKEVHILIGDSPEKIETKLWSYLRDYYNSNHTEEKIIHYNFRYNSNKTYFNHKKNISFADTPAMSLNWGIHYLITFGDGRQVVLSAPYEGYGSLCNNKFDKPLAKYSEQYQWIHWSEERQLFFENTEKAMEEMIKKVNDFFSQDPKLLAEAVDNNLKLIAG